MRDSLGVIRALTVASLFVLSLLGLVVGLLLWPLTRAWEWYQTRAGGAPSSRTVGVDHEGYLSFLWSGDEAEAREALKGAFDLLAEVLPAIGLVESTRSLLVRNPESGFCVTPERLQRLTRDFGVGQRALLWGERLELGKLRVNDALELDLDVLDFRSPRDCQLAVLLPDEETAAAAERALPELVEKHGFSLVQCPGGPASEGG